MDNNTINNQNGSLNNNISETNNRSNTNIFNIRINYKNVNSIRDEILGEKNQLNFRTSKISPSKNILNNTKKELLTEKNNNINNELFYDLFLKRIKKLESKKSHPIIYRPNSNRLLIYDNINSTGNINTNPNDIKKDDLSDNNSTKIRGKKVTYNNSSINNSNINYNFLFNCYNNINIFEIKKINNNNTITNKDYNPYNSLNININKSDNNIINNKLYYKNSYNIDEFENYLDENENNIKNRIEKYNTKQKCSSNCDLLKISDKSLTKNNTIHNNFNISHNYSSINNSIKNKNSIEKMIIKDYRTKTNEAYSLRLDNQKIKRVSSSINFLKNLNAIKDYPKTIVKYNDNNNLKGLYEINGLNNDLNKINSYQDMNQNKNINNIIINSIKLKSERNPNNISISKKNLKKDILNLCNNKKTNVNKDIIDSSSINDKKNPQISSENNYSCNNLDFNENKTKKKIINNSKSNLDININKNRTLVNQTNNKNTINYKKNSKMNSLMINNYEEKYTNPNIITVNPSKNISITTIKINKKKDLRKDIIYKKKISKKDFKMTFNSLNNNKLKSVRKIDENLFKQSNKYNYLKTKLIKSSLLLNDSILTDRKMQKHCISNNIPENFNNKSNDFNNEITDNNNINNINNFDNFDIDISIKNNAKTDRTNEKNELKNIINIYRNNKGEDNLSSLKTNEFESKNLSEFPINDNIIKSKIEKHNKLYINNNNIMELSNTMNKKLKKSCINLNFNNIFNDVNYKIKEDQKFSKKDKQNIDKKEKKNN